MGKVEEAVRSTVTRAVNRQLRNSVVPLARDVRELKRIVSSLAHSVASLQEMANKQARQALAERTRLEASAEEVKAARMSPRLIHALRARLKLTQEQFAAILGVSAHSVTAWEAGRAAPRGANRAALVAMRKLGRRDVKKMLADKAAAAPAKKPAPRRKVRRRRVKRAARKKK